MTTYDRTILEPVNCHRCSCPEVDSTPPTREQENRQLPFVEVALNHGIGRPLFRNRKKKKMTTASQSMARAMSCNSIVLRLPLSCCPSAAWLSAPILCRGQFLHALHFEYIHVNKSPGLHCQLIPHYPACRLGADRCCSGINAIEEMGSCASAE